MMFRSSRFTACCRDVSRWGVRPAAAGSASGVETGVAALTRAVAQEPNLFESNVRYNLILREKAKLEPDPEEQQAIIAEAMTYQAKAKASAQAKKSAPAA